MLTTGSESEGFALKPESTRVLSQGVDDPDHFLHVLSAVALKLLPHLAALILRHVAEVNT